MELSAPAYTILGLNVVQILGVVIFLMMSNLSPAWKVLWILVCIVSMGIGAVLMTGVINCMVYGNCTTFAWLIVGLFIVYFVIALLSSIAYYLAGYTLTAQMPRSLLSQPEFSVKDESKHYDDDESPKKRYYEEKKRRHHEHDDDEESDDE